jgi:hypothetical protein
MCRRNGTAIRGVSGTWQRALNCTFVRGVFAAGVFVPVSRGTRWEGFRSFACERGQKAVARPGSARVTSGSITPAG